jgi:2-polyprenyl-6-methoxyphenol hydroxylase-like FAD-dependent oxidoreductase
MKTDRTEVLVVGAGPVGLLTAVLLAETGVAVQIIDREDRTTARSYACALHPRTLKLLGRLGLAEQIIAQGRRIPTVAFYDGAARRAEIKLSELGGEFPFLLVLPQSVLEEVLEQRLRQKAGAKVKWNHRLDRFQTGEDGVVATVEKLAGTAMGYIVPHWETMVQSVISIRARFMVGADGHNSMVRQRLNLEYEKLGAPQSFVTCEFASDTEIEPEVRVVLDDTSTNVLWPLPDHEFRWTFQLVHAEGPHDFPEKDRRAMPSIDQALNERIREGLERLINRRAPWFSAKIGAISWCKHVAFEARLARQFGEGRCWLAGDAAHQTGPVGVQSLNVGLCDAAALAEALAKVIREEAPRDILKAYSAAQRDQWGQLLGPAGGIWAGSETDAWVRERCARILPCLPASGNDLARLAGQLRLEFGTDAAKAA